MIDLDLGPDHDSTSASTDLPLVTHRSQGAALEAGSVHAAVT
jgi:hypothetical protein